MEYRNPKDLKPHPVSINLYGDNHIDDILESIRQFGILTPLTITSNNLIISGHRRWHSAIKLGLDSVPVEIKNYDNELNEKRAILEFNKQREKTFSQKMNEANLIKEIVSDEAKLRISHTPTPTLEEGETADIVGRKVNIGGHTTFRKAEKIWDKANNGDIKAKKLVEQLDKQEITINKAYQDIEPPHVAQNNGENEWYTPLIYIESAINTMGSIDTDPASSDLANKTIQAKKHFTLIEDGRLQKWDGNVWMNPPYAQPLVTEFCDLLVNKYLSKEINQACVLVNNATETNFYQNMLKNCDAVCFIKGRVKFLDVFGNEGAPLQGQTVLYFGNNTDKFSKYFSQFGVILYDK
jgi:ParB family chromosome partitioning protein